MPAGARRVHRTRKGLHFVAADLSQCSAARAAAEGVSPPSCMGCLLFYTQSVPILSRTARDAAEGGPREDGPSPSGGQHRESGGRGGRATATQRFDSCAGHVTLLAPASLWPQVGANACGGGMPAGSNWPLPFTPPFRRRARSLRRTERQKRSTARRRWAAGNGTSRQVGGRGKRHGGCTCCPLGNAGPAVLKLHGFAGNAPILPRSFAAPFCRVLLQCAAPMVLRQKHT